MNVTPGLTRGPAALLRGARKEEAGSRIKSGMTGIGTSAFASIADIKSNDYRCRMVTFFGAIIAMTLLFCCLAVMPVAMLLRWKFNRLALVVSIIIPAGLYYDHIRNWDGISYPLWMLRGFDDFFPLPFFAGVIAIAWVVKVILSA